MATDPASGGLFFRTLVEVIAVYLDDDGQSLLVV